MMNTSLKGSTLKTNWRVKMRHFSPKELTLIIQITAGAIFAYGALHCLANRSRWDEVHDMDKPGYTDKSGGSIIAKTVCVIAFLILLFVLSQIWREHY